MVLVFSNTLAQLQVYSGYWQMQPLSTMCSDHAMCYNGQSLVELGVLCMIVAWDVSALSALSWQYMMMVPFFQTMTLWTCGLSPFLHLPYVHVALSAYLLPALLVLVYQIN